jgi:hypothetical protein
MPYAVLQTDLTKPTIEQLQRAIRSVPGLTPADAHILGNDAFGILLKNASEQQAGTLQGALRLEGVETEIVDQSFLPALPEIRFVHRLDCTPEHLLIYDPLGKSFALDWRHIMFIAAGAVRLTDFVRHREKRQRVRYTANGTAYQDTEYETVSREEQNCHLIAEIIITGAVLRYTVTADKFNFAGLGDRKTPSVAGNFSILLGEIIQFSANAALNRGAEAIRVGKLEGFSYPSKNAFYEEIVWNLWQMKKAA